MGRTRARPELGEAPRYFTPAAVRAVALGTLSAAVRAAVWWMRGHTMPTGAGHEGTPNAAVRGQPLPTIKTQDQDSARAIGISL